MGTDTMVQVVHLEGGKVGDEKSSRGRHTLSGAPNVPRYRGS